MHGGSSNLTKGVGNFNLLTGNLPGPVRERKLIFADCSVGVTKHINKNYKFLGRSSPIAMAVDSSDGYVSIFTLSNVC